MPTSYVNVSLSTYRDRSKSNEGTHQVTTNLARQLQMGKIISGCGCHFLKVRIERTQNQTGSSITSKCDDEYDDDGQVSHDMNHIPSVPSARKQRFGVFTF